MQALLDTHALLWWLDGDKRLSEPARDFIGEEANTVFVSAASAWEIPTKVRIGKLPGAVEAAAGLAAAVTSQGFTELPISITDGTRAGSLPGAPLGALRRRRRSSPPFRPAKRWS